MIRAPRASDQGFIASTWTKSMGRGLHFYERHGTMRTGYQINQLVDATLDRKDTKALVRVKPNDPDVILGWVLYAEGAGVPIVHYLYTRADNREQGIAGQLLHQIGVRRDAGVVCTSDGPASRMLRTLYPAAVHLPLAEFLKPGR